MYWSSPALTAVPQQRLGPSEGTIAGLNLAATHADTGGAVEAASEKARLALWFGLSRACEEALALLKGQQPAQQQQQQQAAAGAAGGTSAAAGGGGGAAPALSGGPPAPSPATSGGTAGGFTGLEVSSGTPGGGAGGGGGGAKGAKQAEAKMDWFGIEVRAQVSAASCWLACLHAEPSLKLHRLHAPCCAGAVLRSPSIIVGGCLLQHLPALPWRPALPHLTLHPLPHLLP